MFGIDLYKRVSYLLFSLAVILFLASGCSNRQKPVFPVSGQVVYGPNKKPAVGVMVMLTPIPFDVKDPARSMGTVDESGSFAITTYKAGDGAPVGEYVITLTWPSNTKSVFDEDTGDRLKGVYADTTKSKLKFTNQAVKAGNEIPTIELP